MLDLRQLHQFGTQGFQALRGDISGAEYKSVRQGISFEAIHDIAPVVALLELLKSSALGNEREAAHIRVLLQARFDLGDGLRVCIQLQKQAQLRRSRELP